MKDDVREALARFALEKLGDALVVLGEGGRVLEANRGARAVDLDLAALFERRGADGRLTRFFEELESTREATALVTSPRGVPYRLEGTRVDALAVVAIRDLSDERRHDEELEKMRFRASLGVAAATVVHDFNNLLTPILIMSSRLARELEVGSRSTMASMIHTSASLATALARDLLALAKPRTPVVQPLGVNDTVLELAPLLERLLGEDVRLILALDPDAGDAMLDRKRLEHALLNLVVNARDALPDGGEITIRTRAVHDELRPRVLLAVSDTGVGMTSDVRARAFDGFFTTKAELGGVGLGLTSVRHFAADSGADITIDSEPQKGTTVMMLFDRLAHGAGAPPLPTPDLARGGAGETVLVADRDDSVRKAVQVALEGAGYQVVLAATQESAEDRACEERVRVAILDDRLMGRDADAFLCRLRESRPDLRVVVMCDVAADEAAAGATMLLRKAFSDQDLFRTLRRALDGA